jgi:xylan 1,4-beta-xylosidase
MVEPELGPRRPAAPLAKTYSFFDEDFRRDFMTLRIPWDPATFSITERPGWLRIRGKESPVSIHRQALIARRQTDFCFTARTVMDFEPDSFQQMAGLIYRYDESVQYYLRATWDEDRGTRTLGLLVFDRKEMTLPLGRDEVDIGTGEVRLQLTVRFAAAQFWWSRGDRPWQAIGPELDAGKISDDYGGLGFTGAFVGIACQDLQRQEFPADFASFAYEADR